jgi:hypothetical protein
METNNQSSENDNESPDRCETCRFWKQKKGSQWGLCRFNPPAAYYEPGRDGAVGHIPESKTMVWPDTCETDWCGKYEVEKTWPPAFEDGWRNE